MQYSFFEFADEQVLGEGKWPAFLESWSLQLCNDTKMSPQLKSFFFIDTSIVYRFVFLRSGFWNSLRITSWFMEKPSYALCAIKKKKNVITLICTTLCDFLLKCRVSLWSMMAGYKKCPYFLYCFRIPGFDHFLHQLREEFHAFAVYHRVNSQHSGYPRIEF